MRNLFLKYDENKRGYLTPKQLHSLLLDLGCDITIGETNKFIDHLTTKQAKLNKPGQFKGGRILFDEFCTNFLNLPEGYFDMDLSSVTEASLKASEALSKEKGGKLPLPQGTPIEKVEKLFINRMRKQLFDTGMAMHQVLHRPGSHVETFDAGELWNILRSHGMMCSSRMMAELMAFFDHNCDGKLHYEEFCNELLGLPRPRCVRHQTPWGMQKPLSPACQEVVDRLRCLLERGAAGPKKLYQLFRAFDLDGSGNIAYDEFEAMVRSMSVRVKGVNSAQELLKRFDEDGGGSLSYTEFLSHVLKLPPDALQRKKAGSDDDVRPASAELLQQVTENVKLHFLEDPINVKRTMKVFDRSGEGQVSVKEFQDGIESLGLPMSKKQMSELFYQLDDQDRLARSSGPCSRHRWHR